MRVRNRAFFLFLFLFSAPVFASADERRGDAFVTSSIAEPSNLIPFLASDSASAEVSRLLFNGLVKYDKNLKLTGDLASDWDIEEGGLVIVFHLRKNVRWQDGEPFTARDVAFTFRALTNPSVPTPYGGDFEKVVSLETPDPHTVRVRYKEPFSPGLASWSVGIVPEHLLKDADWPATGFSRNPVGTGPYKLVQWTSGEKLVLRANPDYFEGAPFIARVVYRILPEPTTAFLELETENIDSAALSPLQFKRQTGTPFFKTHYAKYAFPSFSYTYIGYNLRNPLFADKKVRKAIGLAIHKQEIIDTVLLGYGRAATGPFLADGWAADPAIGPSGFDPSRAKALLAEAGWRDTSGDGILDRGGRRFSFTILTNWGNTDRKMACEIIQKRLRDVGIEMNIQTLEWSVLLREFIGKKRFEAVLLGWQLSPEPDPYDIFHSSKTGPGQFNFVSYKNEEADRLMEEARRIFPEAERAKIYHRLHGILSEDEPYTFLYVPESLVALHRRFKGVEPAPAGIGHNFIEWYVLKNERKYR
ncbi:MAG: peptide-binding protein [Candidatus Omnitrophica bacterium]|nr:peptide-binding protein [Candidatus Omnitrophota bacterium]